MANNRKKLKINNWWKNSIKINLMATTKRHIR